MPRTYKPSGKKSYKKYDELIMESALNEYRENETSFAILSKKYGIPKSVLHRHYSRIVKKPGGQTVLGIETENYIVENLNYCSEWGYPLDTTDLRMLVKGYLDRVGIQITRFCDNLPGPDFVHSFLKRHKNKISTRICQNIKKSRADVSPDIIEKYFRELEKSIEGVPLDNIVNYDETNLSDDPGKRKVITKRGAKYPERVMNHSKSATSIMMAASASGKLLPCYVVYKALNLYPAWLEKGPTGCRYNRTKSGWFDSTTFEDWVRTVAVPYFDNLDGKKILIGDNLSSHLSIDLIRECKQKNIHFVFLPANSTHLTQPLDVAFFRPVKIAWRNILYTWKKTVGRNMSTVPKNIFPSLLKKMLIKIEENTEANILSGFSKSGISPLNKEKVLERLPGYKAINETGDKEAVNESVQDILKGLRYSNTETKKTTRSKKIELNPGQSVAVDAESYSSDIENNYSEFEEQTTDNSQQNAQNSLETSIKPKQTQEKDKLNRKRKIGEEKTVHSQQDVQNSSQMKANQTQEKVIINKMKKNGKENTVKLERDTQNLSETSTRQTQEKVKGNENMKCKSFNIKTENKFVKPKVPKKLIINIPKEKGNPINKSKVEYQDKDLKRNQFNEICTVTTNQFENQDEEEHNINQFNEKYISSVTMDEFENVDQDIVNDASLFNIDNINIEDLPIFFADADIEINDLEDSNKETEKEVDERKKIYVLENKLLSVPKKKRERLIFTIKKVIF